MIHTQCHPFADLSCGTYTDHFSHMNTARLFTRIGVGIWQKPLVEAGPALSPEQVAELPEDMHTISADPKTAVAAVPGWPEDKPFVSSWGHYPRLHPPGNMILTAPVALLYSFTGLSFSDANRLLILLFLILAHVAFFVFARGGELKSYATPVGFAAAAIVYLELIHWSLEGFYEAIVLVPLVLAARFLAQRRPVEALLAYAIAVTLHFRALFFAPWALYALYLIIRDRSWRAWSPGKYIQATAAVVLSALSLRVFTVIWPYLHTLEIYNPISLANEPVDVPAIKVFILIAVVLVVVLVRARAWLDVAVLLWVGTMLLFMRQAYEWEIVSLLAWLGAPIMTSRPDRTGMARDARLLALLLITTGIFHNQLWPFWLQRVAT
jgi:hypothetical protein